MRLTPFMCTWAPFLPYLFTCLPSSCFSQSFFFSNIELSFSKFCPSLDLTIRRPLSHISPWVDSPRYPPLTSTFYLGIHRRFGSNFEWNPHLGLKLFFFEMCIFDWWLGRMTLLGNVHLLWLIISEFRLSLSSISFWDFEISHLGFRIVWDM
jgi:hypothetical protein